MFMSWHKVQLMEYVHNSWLGTWDVKLTEKPNEITWQRQDTTPLDEEEQQQQRN